VAPAELGNRGRRSILTAQGSGSSSGRWVFFSGPAPRSQQGKDADKGDYSALVKIGIDKAGIMYVEADLQRRSTPQIVADGVEMVRQFRPDGFAIEVNQFQELLCADFIRVGQEQRTHLPIFEINNQVNKQVRIRRLAGFRLVSASPLAPPSLARSVRSLSPPAACRAIRCLPRLA
jgi:hypothetical protein